MIKHQVLDRITELEKKIQELKQKGKDATYYQIQKIRLEAKCGNSRYTQSYS